ncbi:SURF1 family cytochrome oxidase biogenesis protein [Streptoalloteichus hindustanus]|uniref:SURF1-like protein n=1 Tax=Streptoalloteichus hindustanus TaxID=2017 RepID=A0A1M5NNH2_STRHI|nr:SURF1 family cytochrome oxidase biogenesis protein [Streptoalloteichus hindustanus]SHG91096.1 Cytochrome oxidase assembly protein ShyY1 [Streptoalloteichus hindustanus]
MRLKFLFRPGWLAAIVLVGVFAALAFTVLAPWQYHRHEEKQALIDGVRTAEQLAPVPVEEVLPGDQAPDGRTEWRRVVLTGSYLPRGEALLRLRSVQGKAAYEVLTPFQLASGSSVLVNRGYVHPVEGNRVPPFAAPPTGQVSVTAHVRVDEVDGANRDAFTEFGHLQVYVANAATVGRATGLDLRPGFFTLVDGQPGVLGAMPLPDLTTGPHLAYSLQWAGFAIMAILGLGYFAFREAKPDRPKRVSVHDALARDDEDDLDDEPGERVATRSRAAGPPSRHGDRSG